MCNFYNSTLGRFHLTENVEIKFLERIQHIYCVFAFIYVDNIMTEQATKRAS